MDARQLRRFEESLLYQDDFSPRGTPGRSTVTSRMAPGLVLRVSDPETARALGESLRGRDRNGVTDGAERAVSEAAGSSGTPLRSDLRERFEGSLSADLSGVRVHTGETSAAASAAVGAKAYTVGNDIHFAAGQYQPDDPFGMHLIAHEVAHTVQQAGGATQRQHKLEVSEPGDAAEVEADRAADAMVSGQVFGIGAADPTLARAADPGKKDGPSGSVEVTQTSISISGGPVSGKIDWSKPPPSGSIKLETDLMKLPSFTRQVELASFKKVVGLGLEFTVAPTLKANASVTAAGNFEGGKGGQVQLSGGGAVECGLSGTARIIGALGVIGEANVNAGFSGKLDTKTTGTVTITNSPMKLAPDGKPSGGGETVFEGALEADANFTWAADAGTYADKEAKTVFSYQLGQKPLGKVSGLGFELKVGADGTAQPIKWKTDIKWEPPTLPLVESSARPMTPEEKARYRVDDARQADERDGGSGAGAGVPPEAHEPDEESYEDVCADGGSVMCPGQETAEELCEGEDASVMCGSGDT